MSICPRELRDRYHEGRVLPFIGAGASMAMVWTDKGAKQIRGPSWGELVNRATKLLDFSDPEFARVRGTDLQILEYFKLKHGDQIAKLTNWLSQTMNPNDDAVVKSKIHHELALLRRCRLYYTTNYDNFLERAFRLHGRTTHVSAIESQMSGHSADCEVIKFHGDLDHPDQIVLTESDYEKRLKFETPMDFRLRADLLGRVVLFVGYSFRDPNVSYLFRLFTDGFFGKLGSLRGPRAYIAVSDPSDFERELFAARRIEVIGIDGRRRMDDTVELLREMRN